MTTALTRQRTPDEEDQYRKDADATIAFLGPLTFFIVAGGQFLNQSRPILVRSICKDNQSQAAEMLATFAGLGGAAEFMLTPVMGRVSDRFGRRPLLLLSPIACAFLRGMVFLAPGSKFMIMMERTFSSAVVTGFFATMRAMLNDKLEGKDLVVASGAMSMYAGSGVMFGPFIEVAILKYFGARANFAAVSLLNMAVATAMYRVAKETLAVEDRKPLNVADCSPFTFVKMAQVGSVNRRLMSILLFQSFGEIRVLQDINMLFFRENLGWQPGEVSTFMSLIGATVVAGGKTVKASIEKLGMQGHTTMSNITMALSFYAMGMGSSKSTFAKYATQYIALLMWFLGGRKRDAVETNCTAITIANSNMGKGQVAAALSNFKSMGAIFGPPMMAKAYAVGLRRGEPGLPYHLVAGLYLLAEAIHRTMTREQMGIKEGQ